MKSLVDELRSAIDEDEQLALDSAAEVGDGHWQQRNARIVTIANRDREVADYAITECIWHIVRHDPARVLREVAAKRELLADILDERHEVVEDCWYTCPAATEEREGETTCNDALPDNECRCGRDKRVMRRLAIMAKVYGIEMTS